MSDPTAPPLPWPVLDPIPDGWLGDTPPETVQAWRRMEPAGRWAAALGARATARVWLLAGERLRHPALSEPALRARVRERLARPDDAGA